jgi:hypothetical protein
MKSRLSKDFKNVTVLYQDKSYSIEIFYNAKSGNMNLAVVKGDYVDYPVIMPHKFNAVAFDRPERLSKKIMAKVREIALNIDRP